MRWLLLLIVMLLASVVSADTVSPRVVFSNGLTLSSNELSDDMISPEGLGLMFDSDLNTSWKFQKRDVRYGSKSAKLSIESEKYPLTQIVFKNECDILNKVIVTNKSGIGIGTLSDDGGGRYIVVLDNESNVNVVFQGPNVCISKMDIFSNGVELTNNTFISDSGGSYSKISFYANNKWVEKFSSGNVDRYYYLSEGRYVCFVLNFEFGPPSGIRLYNTKTLARLDILKGEYLDASTIKWSGNVVVGILLNPQDGWKKKHFRIVVSFP